MKNRYLDLIEQTFNFPQEDFSISNNNLVFQDLSLMDLITRYGTPLRFTYLPSIGKKIDDCRNWFSSSFKKHGYNGKYHYSYCTKSSHFNFVLEECAFKKVNIETSSAFDIDIVISLFKRKLISRDVFILCNGFKTEEYVKRISNLIKLGFTNVIPIIDNFDEIDLLDKWINNSINLGIRIASEEDPKFEFYTSRLGIGYKDVLTLFNSKIKNHHKFSLTMLHFFVNTGIKDNAYYWNELRKFLKVFTEIKQNKCSIKHLNIGGGFPIKNSLSFEFDYQYMIDEIISQIKEVADLNNIEHPNIFTEFGSYTVAESGGIIFSIVNQKKQNDKERWNMINGSFMTTLPDSWAINKRFIMLPINRWNEKYERVFLGGLTCDSDDYYNSEQHVNAIYLPEFNKQKVLHIGFFNCGAYQEAISGYGGIKHCLIPSPKHILINKSKDGTLCMDIFKEEQESRNMLKILGYT